MKTLLFTISALMIAVFVDAQTIVGTAPTNKNVILEELTGKTCGYCPDGHKRADQLMAANPGRVVVLNIHTGGYASGTPNYRTAWGDYVASLFTVTGYPTGAINRTDFGAGVFHSRGSWVANAATTLGQSSPVNVGGNAVIDLDARTLTVDVEAYYTANGPGTSNRIHVIVTQNNIYGPQSGASTFYPEMLTANGDYTHNKMVRYNMTPNAGDNINTITAGTVYNNQYTWTVPTQINNIPVNLADLKVAVYVSEGTNNGAIITGDYASTSFNTTTPLGISNDLASVEASLGAVCGTSTNADIKVTNLGQANLTTATIEYTVNFGAVQTYTHTFSGTGVATGYYDYINVPVNGLTAGGASNTINFDITMLNGVANPNVNGSYGHNVSTASSISADGGAATISLTLDQYPAETDWELYDETAGSVVASGGGYSTANQTITPVSVNLVNGNCYRFMITDSYGDGICCSYGNGSFSLIGGTAANPVTFISGGNFTSEDGIKFVFQDNTATSITETQSVFNDVKVYPNPFSSNAMLSFDVKGTQDTRIEMINSIGQIVNTMDLGMITGIQNIELNAGDLSTGVYLVNVISGTQNISKKITITK